MNPKEVCHNTAYSVQLPYIAGLSPLTIISEERMMVFAFAFLILESSVKIRMLLNSLLINICNYKINSWKNKLLWKTMPGRIKQIPQDSTEWDRTDTGHCTETSTLVISIWTLVLNPLVISYKKYIFWKLSMRFIRVWLTSSIITYFFPFIFLQGLNVLEYSQSIESNKTARNNTKK